MFVFVKPNIHFLVGFRLLYSPQGLCQSPKCAHERLKVSIDVREVLTVSPVAPNWCTDLINSNTPPILSLYNDIPYVYTSSWALIIRKLIDWPRTYPILDSTVHYKVFFRSPHTLNNHSALLWHALGFSYGRPEERKVLINLRHENVLPPMLQKEERSSSFKGQRSTCLTNSPLI